MAFPRAISAVAGGASAIVGAIGTLGAFWAGNVITQYVSLLMPQLASHVTTEGGAQAPGFFDFVAHRLAEAPLAISLDRSALVVGASCAAVALIVILAHRGERKLPDVMGSQRWSTLEERMAYAHASEVARVGDETRPWPKPAWCETVDDDNLIVSRNTRIGASSHPFFAKNVSNRHAYMIAGSGAGKTYSFIQTNAMQCNGTLFFTDPKAENFRLLALFLERRGYRVVWLDLRGGAFMRHNIFHYNPMHYATSMTDISQIADMLIANTTSENSRGDDQFFTSMEKIVYTCLLGYFFYYFKHRGHEEDCNLPLLLDFLALTKETADGVTGLDILFYGTKEKDGYMGFAQWLVQEVCGGDEDAAHARPEWAILTNYDGFVSAAKSPETMASIVSSCYARLRDFATADVRSLLKTDDLALDRFGSEKTAFFAIIPDGGSGTFSFISAMVLHQLFRVSIDIADNRREGHLEIPIWCYLDELANVGKLPGLDTLVATMRSRWINLVSILQDDGQLENVYGKSARQIYSNSAIHLYYGSSDYQCCERLSKEIGDTTVWLTETSTSKSHSGTSVSTSRHAYKVPLIDAATLYNGGMEPGWCLTHYKNDRWIRDETPDPTQHPRWAERCAADRDLGDFMDSHGCATLTQAWGVMHGAAGLSGDEASPDDPDKGVIEGQEEQEAPAVVTTAGGLSCHVQLTAA